MGLKKHKLEKEIDNILEDLKNEGKFLGTKGKKLLYGKFGESASYEDQARKLQIDEIRKEIEQKERTLNKLFKFLAIESIALFVIALLQGFECINFHLDAWTLRILVTATIIQITLMLKIALRYLFRLNK